MRQGNVTSCPETEHTCPYYLWPRYDDSFLVIITATGSAGGNGPPSGWPFAIWPGVVAECPGDVPDNCVSWKGSNDPEGPACSQQWLEEEPMRFLALVMRQTTPPWVITFFGTSATPLEWAMTWTVVDSPSFPWDQTTLDMEAKKGEAIIDRFIDCGDWNSPIFDVFPGQPNQTVLLSPKDGGMTITYRRYSHQWYDLTLFGVGAFWPLVAGKSIVIKLVDRSD